MKGAIYRQERSGFIRDEGLGLIHVCHGPGVGKTTRSIGLAVRAAGAGLKVVYVQFLKSGQSSETVIFASIPNLEYKCPGKHPFILSKGPREAHYQHAEKALGYAREASGAGVDLLVCDELLSTIFFKVLAEEQILDLMESCRGRVELVLTGMKAPRRIIDAADYVTKFVQEKHPYYQGHIARKGIEF